MRQVSTRRRQWATAGAFVILALLFVQLRVGLDAAGRRIGVTYNPTAPEIRILAVESGSPAEAGGVRAGDLLLSIDGQPLRESADFDRLALGFRRGQPVELEIGREERRLRLDVVPGVAYQWGDYLLSGVACVLYLALGLIASSQRTDDLRATLLSAFCFAVALELALPIDLLGIETAAGLLTQVAFLLLTGLQFGLDLHLATVLPVTPPWLAARPWVVRLYYSVGGGIGFVAAASLAGMALGVESLTPLADALSTLVWNWLLPAWAVAIMLIIGRRAFAHPDPRGRLQAGIVLLGVMPWVAVVLYDTIHLWLVPDADPLSGAVWNFALLAYPVAVFVAIFLYRLFDLELMLRKSLLWGSLTTLLVLGFYLIVAGLGAVFARQFGDEGVPFWVLSSAGLTMGLLFNPLRARLQREIDRRLFPERLALRSRLVALAAELPAQGKLPRMGEHLANELSRIFSVDPVSVWLATPPHGQLVQLATSGDGEVDFEQTALVSGDDPALVALRTSDRPVPAATLAAASPVIGQRLEAVDAQLVVPLQTRERLVGLLTVGVKRESQRWAAEETELLTLVGHHAATVFENARLFDSATYEGLTGLYRREALLEILDREWSRSQRYARPLAVALVDLDHFKEVNDRFGHLTGDLVLQRVATELRNQLRETDFIGRYGGEEFLYVLPETTLEGAKQFSEKVRQKIERLEILTETGKAVQVTVSVGVAAREGGRGDGRARGRALLAAADEALYDAKREGRNQVVAAAGRA